MVGDHMRILTVVCFSSIFLPSLGTIPGRVYSKIGLKEGVYTELDIFINISGRHFYLYSLTYLVRYS